jgi:hypothetical protein
MGASARRGRRAPCRHLATDCGELAGRELSGCRGKQLPILDVDVLLVDRLERREVGAKRTGRRRIEAAGGKPAPAERVDRAVMLFRFVMIPFESREHVEGVRRRGIPGLTETGEQALFFVGGVLRCGGREISERPFDVRARRRREGPTSEPLVDRDQDAEEILDPAMAIAQQAERFVEAVIRTLADVDGMSLIMYP